MPYFFHKHTADIRMSVEGKTLEEFFQDALLGMVEIMNPVRGRDALRVLATSNGMNPERWQEARAVKREIAVEAPDATALLVDFLNEALAWMHIEREMYTAVRFQSLSECSLKAELEGYKIELFGGDIKAVTYHEADVKKNDEGEWRTTIIFDI